MNKEMIIAEVMKIPQFKHEKTTQPKGIKRNTVSLFDIAKTKELSSSTFTYSFESQKEVICDILKSNKDDQEIEKILLGIIETEGYQSSERYYAFNPDFIAPLSEIIANYK